MRGGGFSTHSRIRCARKGPIPAEMLMECFGFDFREAMKIETHRPIVFPPINRHGIIGDRRTGALVAADGTLDWFCAPDFDGKPIFGALLDPEKGGHCRLGPIEARLGEQHGLRRSADKRA
jgi:trehalase-like protein